MKTKLSITTTQGQQEITVGLEDYAEAEAQGISLPALLNKKYPTNVQRDGSAFAQAMAGAGMFLSSDPHYGVTPPTLKQLFDGTSAQLSGSAITRPDGADRFTPAGRLLFPAVMIDLLESSLRENKEGYNAAFMDMVAFTRSVNSSKYDQVVIDYSKPRAARGKPISQLAEPQRMLSITTSSVSRSIPTMSIGMEISKEAQAAATLDLVGLAVREHSLEERADQLMNDFLGIVNGDVDRGEAGIIGGAVGVATYDSTVSAANTLSQKAWVKFLRTNWRKRNITHVVTDIDTYIAIQARTGRPTANDQSTTDERLNTIPRVMLPGIPGDVKVFVMESFLAKTIVGLDSSKAMRRVVYTGAEYNAIEEFVMRKATALRIDWAEVIESAGYSDAFSVMTLI